MNFLQFMMANRQHVLELTFEHITLAGIATLLAALVGIPLGILITRMPKLSKPVLGARTSFRPSRAWLCSASFSRLPGSEIAQAGWRFWLSRSTHSYR